jgi:hypothetical protein
MWQIIETVPGASIGYRAIIDQDGYTVCVPSPMGGDNARLIASAPAMLEALKAIADQTVAGGTINTLARTAIRNATGGHHD